MFLWNYEIEFATQILDNIFQISLHIWAVFLLFYLLRPVYHNQLIYNLSLINVHKLFMELKGQNSFHCSIYIKHVIFHSVIFLLSFRNLAINLLSYLLAGVQPRLIQGIRSGDGVGDLFNYLFIKDIKSNRIRIAQWGNSVEKSGWNKDSSVGKFSGEKKLK